MGTLIFYDVKTREKIKKESSDVKKTKYERPLTKGTVQIRYALRALHDGRWLTKFCTKADWDVLKVEEIA
jgi:hypothetical protein